MILPFSTTINGKPTRFVEKIWEAIFQKGIQFNAIEMNIGKEALPKGYVIKTNIPKLHTIRKDKKDRWKPGIMIDFFINTRTKDMFRFAPRIPVVSTQKITMSYEFNDVISISINSRELLPSERIQLAINDGFDSWQDFFNYFYPVIKNTEENFWKGKIIHWTDLKY